VPQFFIPGAETPEQAEEAWLAVKRFTEEQTGWEVSDRRVFRIDYEHHDRQESAEVGRPFRVAEVDGDTPPECLIILESNSFLVCTYNRGAARGMPYLVGVPHTVVDFD
jgi:hypothetical protein